jgi:hypothetical protein
LPLKGVCPSFERERERKIIISFGAAVRGALILRDETWSIGEGTTGHPKKHTLCCTMKQSSPAVA